MINLIKYELSKIFHKKGLYIYCFIILFIFAFAFVIDKVNFSYSIEDTYWEQVEKELDSYDIDTYIEEKTAFEVYKLSKDYEYSSPEAYFIENDIATSIRNMNEYKYRNKDDESYNEAKKEYDKLVVKLNNFDWKKDLEEKKASYEKELAELRSLHETTDDKASKDSIDSDIKNAEVYLYLVNYRIKNEIPYAYNSVSNSIDRYPSLLEEYNTINKNDNVVKTKAQIYRDNDTIKEYNELKYKLDNNLINNKDDVQQAIIDDVVASKLYVFIAFLIIAGGLFAEEFNKGTIKQLLIRPYTRTQIYVSKIVASVIATAMFMLFMLVVFNVFEIINYKGIGNLFSPVVVYSFSEEKVLELSVVRYLLIDLLATLPKYIILAGICILAGIWLTSTVSAVLAPLGIEIFSGFISLLPERIQAIIPFKCWDLTEFMFGNISSNQYSSLPLSLTISIITIILLFVLSLIIFKKKDIKNQ